MLVISITILVVQLTVKCSAQLTDSARIENTTAKQVTYSLSNSIFNKDNNVNHSIQESLKSTCYPSCQNFGLCWTNPQNGESSCVCTPDYKGLQCELDAQPPLKYCDESTCKNDGQCSGEITNPKCLCKEGVFGRTCERRTIFVHVNMGISPDTVGLQWETYADDPANIQYQKLQAIFCNFVKVVLENGNVSWLANSLASCHLDGYEKGSTILSIDLGIDVNSSMIGNFKPLPIKEQLSSGYMLMRMDPKLSKIGSTTNIINPRGKGLEAFVINPCDIRAHDCSNNAKCIPDYKGLYTCTCNSFTIDASLDAAYPGRRCLYDGLIILAFTLIGAAICTLSILIFGCRRTIWRRNRQTSDQVDLMNISRTYEI